MDIYALSGWLSAEAAAVDRVPVVSVVRQALDGGQALRVDSRRGDSLADPLIVADEITGEAFREKDDGDIQMVTIKAEGVVDAVDVV